MDSKCSCPVSGKRQTDALELCSLILAKSSLIQTRLMLGRKLARKHCFRAIAHDSAKPVSKLGSLIPQHKRLREVRLRAEHELVRHYA